jgi:hypothetical protein
MSCFAFLMLGFVVGGVAGFLLAAMNCAGSGIGQNE